jgi:hypothetical protein
MTIDPTDRHAVVEALAAAIHEAWRDKSRTEGWSMAPRLDKAFGALELADQAPNRAAAARMPEVLRVAGLALHRADALSPPPIAEAAYQAIIASRIEAMAQVEHVGWMRARSSAGWHYGPTRDDSARLHPSLVAYDALSEAEKEKDRNNIRNYWQFAYAAGLSIRAQSADESADGDKGVKSRATVTP